MYMGDIKSVSKSFPWGLLKLAGVWELINITFNILRTRHNGCHFPDVIFKCIFLNENVWISIKISLKFVHKGPNNNIPALVQRMAWCHPGDKPLSEAIMVSLLTHICVTRPQWVKFLHLSISIRCFCLQTCCSFWTTDWICHHGIPFYHSNQWVSD